MNPDRLADELKKLSVPRDRPARRLPIGWVAIVGILAILAGGWVWSRNSGGPTRGEEREPDEQPFTIAPPPPEPAGLSASGYVVPSRRATLGSKASGRLVEFELREGEKVSEGQLVARLEDKDLAAERTRLAVDRENLARQLERRRELMAKGFVSKEEFEALEAQLRSAEASLQLADARIAETRIPAPFEGVILERHCELGDMIQPGKSIVTLADVSGLFAEVDVTEGQIGRVYVGQRAKITLDAAPDRAYAGTVSQVFPSAVRQKGTVRVRVRFDEPDETVRIDLTVRVAFMESKD